MRARSASERREPFMLLIHHYQLHHPGIQQVPSPATPPPRPFSAPQKRSPPAETGQPVRTPYGVRGRRLARRQIPLRLAVRPPFSAIPRGEYIVLMQFLVSAGGSETVGWRVRGRLVAGFSRDGGKAGGRPASEPPWAFRFSGKACDVPRERAIYIPNWVPSAATCEQAGRRTGRHATGLSGKAHLSVCLAVSHAGWPMA